MGGEDAIAQPNVFRYHFPMTPQAFIEKWRDVELKERSASQSHFNDLCRLLDVLDPTTADPKGTWFTFEKGAFQNLWRRRLG